MTLQELRANIERKIAATLVALCEKVVENWVQRLDFVCHAKEIEFNS